MNLANPSGLKKMRIFNDVTLEDIDNTASQLASLLEFGDVIYLTGDLGAGKTTFVSALVHQYDESVTVSSPTFSLLHEYPLNNKKKIIHLDLYRIQQPDELEFIGIRDYMDEEHLIFIEWWQNGLGFIPAPDYVIEFSKHPDNDALRTVTLLCENWLLAPF